MAVGYGIGVNTPPVAMRLILPPDSLYIMDDPNGWHKVSPITGPGMSIMVTGKPWSRVMPKKVEKLLHKLTEKKKDEVLSYFEEHYTGVKNFVDAL